MSKKYLQAKVQADSEFQNDLIHLYGYRFLNGKKRYFCALQGPDPLPLPANFDEILPDYFWLQKEIATIERTLKLAQNCLISTQQLAEKHDVNPSMISLYRAEESAATTAAFSRCRRGEEFQKADYYQNIHFRIRKGKLSSESYYYHRTTGKVVPFEAIPLQIRPEIPLNRLTLCGSLNIATERVQKLMKELSEYRSMFEVFSKITTPEMLNKLTVIRDKYPQFAGYVLKSNEIYPLQFHQLKQPIPQLKQSIPPLEQPIAQLKQPIPPLEQPIAQLKQPIPPLKQPIAQLKQPIPPLEQPIAQLKQPIAQLKQSIAPLEQPIPPFERPIAQLKQSIPPLEQPITKLKQPIESVKKYLKIAFYPINDDDQGKYVNRIIKLYNFNSSHYYFNIFQQGLVLFYISNQPCNNPQNRQEQLAFLAERLEELANVIQGNEQETLTYPFLPSYASLNDISSYPLYPLPAPRMDHVAYYKAISKNYQLSQFEKHGLMTLLMLLIQHNQVVQKKASIPSKFVQILQWYLNVAPKIKESSPTLVLPPLINPVQETRELVNLTEEQTDEFTGQWINPSNQGINPSNQGINPSNQEINPSNQGINPSNQGINPSNQGINSFNEIYLRQAQKYEAERIVDVIFQEFNPSVNQIVFYLLPKETPGSTYMNNVRLSLARLSNEVRLSEPNGKRVRTSS